MYVCVLGVVVVLDRQQFRMQMGQAFRNFYVSLN